MNSGNDKDIITCEIIPTFDSTPQNHIIRLVKIEFLLEKKKMFFN